MTEAGERWRRQLLEWAIPEHIVAQAEVAPWAHDPATFAIDDTIDPASPIFAAARDLLPPDGGSVMDIGCGGGRSSVPLAPRATHLVGVDESPAMLARFAQAAEERGVSYETVQGRWPDVAIERERAGHPLSPCDVVVCHHVLFNVPDLEPFLVALTSVARLGVVVVIPAHHPLSAWNPAWKHFWDLDRPTGPTSDDAVAVLRALGIEPEIFVVPRPPMTRLADDPQALVVSARRRLCLPASRDEEIADWLADHPPQFMREVVVLRWPGGLS